jgi:hypothetical protein
MKTTEEITVSERDWNRKMSVSYDDETHRVEVEVTTTYNSGFSDTKIKFSADRGTAFALIESIKRTCSRM